MSSTHKVPVIRIQEIEKHPNADSLGIVRTGGYQVVVKLGEFVAGDLAAYIQPDSVVPELPEYSFLWTDARTGLPRAESPVPVKYRRVTARRFRKEWSEGLLIKLEGKADSSLAALAQNDKLKEGEDAAELLGITHYEPEEEVFQQTRGEQYKRWPRSLRGWFYWIARKLGFDLNGMTGGENERGPKNPPPVYDVEAYKNFVGVLEPGEEVIVTEKIHGSNARFIFDGKKFYCGSRKLWKSPESKSIWREAVRQNPWIEERCRANPGCTLYGEVVPTQKFKGGESVSYGTGQGEVKFLEFDMLDENGNWLAPLFDRERNVPLLYRGPFDRTKIQPLVDGTSSVPGAAHIKEGIVILAAEQRRVRGLNRVQFKIVSNDFLVKT